LGRRALNAARVIGKALRCIRAGDKYLAWNDAALADVPDRIRLVSAAFAEGRAIPARYAGVGVGENISPPLSWSGVPHEAAELVLIVQDPDAAFDQAVSAGAIVVWPVSDQYGWRLGRIVDPFGHHWEIGKPLSEGS